MIPKKIHFVYGLRADFNKLDFSLMHWAAIKSAIKVNPGYEIHYWYQTLPETYYFDSIRDLLILHKIEAPSEIFGNPLNHFAHQADVVRMLVLQREGGIYLDIDTICRRSFDPLLSNSFVMAYEEVGNKKVGLCNAIMLAEQNSDFLAIWLNSYKSFRSKGRDAYWGEHSVVIPYQLSQLHPTLITVLPTDSFFQPAYDSVGLAMLFIEDRVFPNAYAHHLWESLSYGAIRPINEFNFEHIRNTYTSILSEVLSDELKVLRDHCQLKIDQAFTRKEASLNLGCGSKRELDKINCDLYPQTAAELNFDLEQPNWPIPDSSVKYVKVNHVLEHLQNKEVFFKELYRICANNASISIAVPYPRHDWSLIDPTHVSYWHPDSFRHFDKQICTEWLFSDSTNTPLAIYWDINFKVISVNAQTEGAKTSSELKKIFNTDKIDLNLLNRYFNNVASEVKVELIALK